MNFTPEQLKNFIDYQRIQRGGRFNMFDPRARSMTRQSVEEWTFNMKNYNELNEAIKPNGESK